MSKRKKSPQLPLLVEVSDYRKLGAIEHYMQLVNPNVKVKRVGEGVLVDAEEKYGIARSDYGVVYEGRHPSKKTIMELFEDVSFWRNLLKSSTNNNMKG